MCPAKLADWLCFARYAAYRIFVTFALLFRIFFFYLVFKMVEGESLRNIVQ